MRIPFALLAFLYVWLISAPIAVSQSTGEEPQLYAEQPTAGPKEATPELQRPTVWGEPTEVRVLIYVIDVDGVDSANQNFSASVYYEAHWNSPMLRHDGPGPAHRLMTEVWTPRLTIVNQQQAWNAFPHSVEVFPNGDVVLRQKVWGWFSQPLELRNFPLDQQTLTVHIVTAELLESQVAIEPAIREHGRVSGIARKFSLPDFDVLTWKAEPRPYSPFEGELGAAGFALDISVERHASYYFWKIIFPLCLIVVMSWIPRWIDPRQIGPNVGIATTAFLTLVAYLFAVAHLLPRVSYLTRMDTFILLSTVIVFIGLVQTVATSTLTRREVPPSVKRIDRWSRVIYPLVLLGVLGVSFGL